MSVQDKANYYLSQLDKELSKYPALVNLERKFQAPKAFVVLGVGALLSTFIFFNLFAGILTNLIGWILPTLFSIRALESPGVKDDQQWLTYWIVFGALQCLENMVTLVRWFPYYYVAKTAFIVYLILPSTRGAERLYATIIRPVSSSISKALGSAAPSAAPAAAPAAPSSAPRVPESPAVSAH